MWVRVPQRAPQFRGETAMNPDKHGLYRCTKCGFDFHAIDDAHASCPLCSNKKQEETIKPSEGIPDFLNSLDKMRAIHIKKNADYAATGSPHENFEHSALIASWFKNNADVPYAVLIAIKLARLATLLNSGHTPNNESVEDTFIDLANYVLLWKASRVTS